MKPFPWRTVTGADFRRSMDWAKGAPRLRDLIKRVIKTNIAGEPHRGE